MSVLGLLTPNPTLDTRLSLSLVTFRLGHSVPRGKGSISRRQRGVDFSEYPVCPQPCHEHGWQGRWHDFQTLILRAAAEGVVGE